MPDYTFPATDAEDGVIRWHLKRVNAERRAHGETEYVDVESFLSYSIRLALQPVIADYVVAEGQKAAAARMTTLKDELNAK